MKNVVVIDLNSNNLTDKTLSKFSDNFSNLTSLERIYFGKNEFSSEGIIKFSENLSNIQNLNSLILFSNKIGDSANILFQNLLYTKNLKILSLSTSQLIDSSFISFPSISNYIKNLEILYLNENEITDVGLSYLTQEFSSLKQLKIFELRDNMITEVGAENLINIIEDNNLINMEQLTLIGNPIDTSNNPKLLELIKKRNKDYISMNDILKSIESNDYDYDKIKSIVSNSYKIFESIIDLFNKTKNEKHFDLVTSIAMYYFGKHKEKLLKSLDLKNDYIRLRYCNSIKTNLLFGSEYMGYDEKDAEFISQHIKYFDKLDSLNIEYSLLGDDGVSQILDSIFGFTKFTSLYLASSNLTSKFVPSMVKVMQSCPLLKCITFFVNKIDDDGISEFSDYFSSITNLQILSIGCNSFTSKGITHLSQNLSYLSNLEELYINENNIGNDGVNAISDQFSYITRLRNFNIESIIYKFNYLLFRNKY